MASTARPHALVVPALPPSHIISAMRLARALLAVGFDVSFVYFSSRPPHPLEVLPPQDSYMPLASDAGVHTYVIADGIPPHHLSKPFFHTTAMSDNLLRLILHLREQGQPPTCVVSHSFVPWTAPVAQRAGVPRIDFWSSNAFAYLLNLNVSALCQANIFPERATGNGPPNWKSESPLMLDCIPCLPPVTAELYPAPIRFDPEPSLFRSLFNELYHSAQLSERTLICSLSELEPDAFRGLQAMGISAFAIAGPLIHFDLKTREEQGQADDHSSGTAKALKDKSSNVLQISKEQNSDCLLWLDMQADSSVIYVAFGTVAKLSAEDVVELASGLEASGNPFLWAIRDDSVVKPGPRGKGLVTSWAPQVKVLAHKAIGGFLTHCGWNSTIESLWQGVPMLGCPQLGDQRSNTWCVSEMWGTGLELKRTNTGGLQRGYVKAGVHALLQGEEGSRSRKRAEEMKQVVRDACQEKGESFNNLRNFYDDMKALSISQSQEPRPEPRKERWAENGHT